MTVISQAYRNDYLGSNPAITGPYPYTFRITAATDVLVATADLDGNIAFLVLNTDYTITGVGQAGGSITLTNPLATNWALTIVRNQPLLQPTSFANLGPVYPSSVEAALDNIVFQTQTLFDLLNRSIKLPPVTPPAVPFSQITNLPTTLAGYGLSGDAYTQTQTNAQIASALAAALTGYATTAAVNAAIASALTPYRTKTENDALYAAIADDTIPANWNLPWAQVTGAPTPASFTVNTPWAPVDASGAGLSLAGGAGCTYESLGAGSGAIITVNGWVIYPTTSDGTAVQIGGFPAPDMSIAQAYVGAAQALGQTESCIALIGGNTGLAPALTITKGNTTLLNSDVSDDTLFFTITYVAA